MVQEKAQHRPVSSVVKRPAKHHKPVKLAKRTVKRSRVAPKVVHQAIPEMTHKRISRWLWPAKGKVIKAYAPYKGNKGIDIAGRLGEAVRATAGGVVVYSGSGLPGYGKLIILKHNEDYLSAYAHNRQLLVKEGDPVKAGQKIATMGRTGSMRVMLHFEIRRDGKPVNPLWKLRS